MAGGYTACGCVLISRIELAGESPATVGAGAPCSRPRAKRETAASERGVEGPQLVARPSGGERIRRPSMKRTLQPSDRETRKVGWPSRSTHGEGNRLHSRPEEMQDTRGVWRRACGDSSMRNRRGPSRRPTLGGGGSYKPSAKGNRAGRESEGFIVPWMPVDKAGGGKGPCFGHGGVGR